MTDHLTDEELDAIEADKAARAEEIQTAVAEALAEHQASVDELVKEAVAKALAAMPATATGTPGVAPSENLSRGTDGIYHANPAKAKLARDKSKTKQVIALERGFYGVSLIEEGTIFEVPADEKAPWFEDVKGGKAVANAEDELV